MWFVVLTSAVGLCGTSHPSRPGGPPPGHQAEPHFAVVMRALHRTAGAVKTPWRLQRRCLASTIPQEVVIASMARTPIGAFCGGGVIWVGAAPLAQQSPCRLELRSVKPPG
eukprot:s512_g14.t1